MLGFWLYSLFDVVTTPEDEARSIPKTLWALVVIFIPVAGGLLWFLLGRPLAGGPEGGPEGGTAGGAAAPRRSRGEAPKGPDDDPDFLRDIDKRMRGDG
ncbi:hypothetical protein GCM10009560_73680 [Nonomuraea longicatena]|uniref:Cardiolipin synthase N-terminal domain-containing protein n=1 Tax=Nonomuraea longicatena TaxID=83682 RepID=A0ABN1R5K4_9ACTN